MYICSVDFGNIRLSLYNSQYDINKLSNSEIMLVMKYFFYL